MCIGEMYAAGRTASEGSTHQTGSLGGEKQPGRTWARWQAPRGRVERLSRSLPEGPSSGPAAGGTEFGHPARSDSGPGPSPSGFKRRLPPATPLALSLRGSAQFRCPPYPAKPESAGSSRRPECWFHRSQRAFQIRLKRLPGDCSTTPAISSPHSRPSTSPTGRLNRSASASG
jgi:hypothetical protein